MSTPPEPSARRVSGEKKTTSAPAPNVVTRNRAQQAKIQTRAMATGRSKATASASLLAAKKKAMQKKKTCVDTVLRDHYQTAMDAKTLVRGATGLTTDPRMLEHRCLWDTSYPECPERLSSVIDRCNELGLIERCKRIGSRLASREEVQALHSPLVHDVLRATHGSADQELLERVSSKYDAVYVHPVSMSSKYDIFYVHPSTHEVALLAAGSTIDMAEAILRGDVQNGCALVRPPGHHAMRAEPCGYCFYNGAALAARRALDRGVRRVLIVDWDVHHGQATQQMFYDDPRVLYFSVHRYEHGTFWPNLRQSDFHYTGCGAGRGYTFNVPLNATRMQDADYLAIWHQLLLPVALEYQPELVLVSAGYDAALGCPEGEMEVSPACYAHLTHMLLAVCPAVCVVLEGGYCLASLAEGAALTLRTLLGHPPPRLQRLTEPTASIQESILNCIYAHKAHWRCFAGHPTYSADGTPNVSDAGKAKHAVAVRWEGDETRADTFATRDCYPLQSQEFLSDVARRLNHLRLVTDLTIPQHAVCYIYDEAMLKHKNICEPDHVECPERIMRIHERHRDYGLLARLHPLAARRATDEELLPVHTREHLRRLQRLGDVKLRDLNAQKEAFDSLYFHPDSYESAAVAAGCVLQMVEAVVTGAGGSGVCVVRPPGHHASDDLPSGFCLLNNAAVGARYATDCHGLKRVLLLDWDVHHGNGTQKIFESDPRVLYVSLHRYDDGTFFPHSRDADHTNVGVAPAEGFNVNIPWNKRGMGDTEYLAAFTNIVLPIAYEFDPELVIVSAGFDACVGDPLGGCKVSPECYGRLTLMLRGLAHGRVVLCLEGGYNTTSIAYAMTMCTKALLGDPIPHQYEPKAACHWSAIETINNVIGTHKKYWKNLKFQVAIPSVNVLEEPAPSRGLIVSETEANRTGDSASILENSGFNTSTSTLDESAKSDQYNISLLETLRRSMTSVDESLEDSLAGLQIKPKCEGGNCGTDDETDSPAEEKSATGNVSINTSGVSEKIVTRSASQSKSPEQKIIDNKNISMDESLEGNSKRAKNKPKCEGGNCGTDDEADGPSKESLCKNNPCSSKSYSEGSSKTKPDGESSRTNEGSSRSEEGPSKKETYEITLNASSDGAAPERRVTRSSTKRTSGREPATLVDYLAAQMPALANEEMFAVVPLPWCPHLEGLSAVPAGASFEQGARCVDCESTAENWVCLHCYVVACARAVRGHMQAHYVRAQHALALSLADLSVWCSACDAYVDNALLYEARDRAHRAKFGEPMPWCYGGDSSR